jgi:hypothetical protein
MLCPQLVGFKKMADFCRHPDTYSELIALPGGAA